MNILETVRAQITNGSSEIKQRLDDLSARATDIIGNGSSQLKQTPLYLASTQRMQQLAQRQQEELTRLRQDPRFQALASRVATLRPQRTDNNDS